MEEKQNYSTRDTSVSRDLSKELKERKGKL